MISPLAAQWQGGFCQRTCRRCDCSPGSGVQCSISTTNDILASNGVIQGINRVLFPPPIFTKEQAIADAIAYNASVSAPALLGGRLVLVRGGVWEMWVLMWGRASLHMVWLLVPNAMGGQGGRVGGSMKRSVDHIGGPKVPEVIH
jgi:hypothetical protein